MSDKNSPLGGRGKAQEDAWAREQDRQAIEKMKEKDGKGATDTNAGEKTCKCKEAKKAGKKNDDKTGCCGGK